MINKKCKKPLRNRRLTGYKSAKSQAVIGIMPVMSADNKGWALKKSPPFCLRAGVTEAVKVNKPPLIRKIERAITPTVESMGFELVRVLLIGSGKPTLQIMAERPEGGITIDEC